MQVGRQVIKFVRSYISPTPKDKRSLVFTNVDTPFLTQLTNYMRDGLQKRLKLDPKTDQIWGDDGWQSKLFAFIFVTLTQINFDGLSAHERQIFNQCLFAHYCVSEKLAIKGYSGRKPKSQSMHDKLRQEAQMQTPTRDILEELYEPSRRYDIVHNKVAVFQCFSQVLVYDYWYQGQYEKGKHNSEYPLNVAVDSNSKSFPIVQFLASRDIRPIHVTDRNNIRTLSDCVYVLSEDEIERLANGYVAGDYRIDDIWKKVPGNSNSGLVYFVVNTNDTDRRSHATAALIKGLQSRFLVSSDDGMYLDKTKPKLEKHIRDYKWVDRVPDLDVRQITNERYFVPQLFYAQAATLSIIEPNDNLQESTVMRHIGYMVPSCVVEIRDPNSNSLLQVDNNIVRWSPVNYPWAEGRAVYLSVPATIPLILNQIQRTRVMSPRTSQRHIVVFASNKQNWNSCVLFVLGYLLHEAAFYSTDPIDVFSLLDTVRPYIRLQETQFELIKGSLGQWAVSVASSSKTT